MARNTIGRFKVVRQLGSGSQGSVWLCTDPDLQREVAVKLLDRSDLGSEEAAAAFHREARAMSHIQHPNIVAIYEAGREAGMPFLVFEYVRGRLLSEAIKAGEVNPEVALGIFQGLLEGMERAHRQGIVHRDIKPANIILDREGVAKIMDFGIARVLRGEADADRDLTGSPRYMAPEYIERGQVAPQVDVFALGLVLDEMLTGMPVFRGNTHREVLESILKDPVAPPSTFNPSLDGRLDALVLRALEKDPAARYADAGEFLHALREYRGGGEVVAEVGEGKGTIEFLLRRMQRKSDFPALSQSVRTLNAMAATGERTASDMAQVIVKDFALTNKILKVVNSAHYGHFSGKIGTISRAVVVLGFQPIRSLAATLIFYEHLADRAQAADLKAQTSAALYSAVLASRVAADIDPPYREEHFLSAMLYNLGRLLVSYYLPEESGEIRLAASRPGGTPRQAQREVLGVTFAEVGMAVARSWNFPDAITRSLGELPEDRPLKAPGGLDDRRRLVAAFSNQAAAAIGAGGVMERNARQALLDRYGERLGLDGKGLDELTRDAAKEFLDLVGAIGTVAGGNPFLDRLSRPGGREDPGGTETGRDRLGPGSPDSTSRVPRPADREALLTEGLQEVSNIILAGPSLPELCNVVLETMYRAMAFHRVVLCLADRARGSMNGRLGFGAGVDAFVRGFRFPLGWEPDVFHAALKNAVDVHIADSRQQRIQKDLPAWYREISDAESFILFPLVVKGRAIGLIYADHIQANGLQITENTLNLLKALRNQLLLVFRERA